VSEFGIDTANMFGFWDWVGGRYSMDSAIGLSTMLAIGPKTSALCWQASTKWTSTSVPPLREESAGADGPARGLVQRLLWRADGGRATLRSILKRFPAYLQQLTMESNGKQVTLDGTRISDYQTGPIFWVSLAPTDNIRSTS